MIGPTTAIGQAPLLERFDDNGNGVLDPSEIETMEKTRLAAVTKRLDTNGDGSVSLSEAENGGPRLERLVKQWDELDLDNNGELDTAELAAALKGKRRRRPKAPDRSPADREK